MTGGSRSSALTPPFRRSPDAPLSMKREEVDALRLRLVSTVNGRFGGRTEYSMMRRNARRNRRG
jgi:hypothetical protein